MLPSVLTDEDEEREVREDLISGPASFQSKLNKTMDEYQHRKEYNRQWYQEKIESLYQTYNKVTM